MFFFLFPLKKRQVTFSKCEILSGNLVFLPSRAHYNDLLGEEDPVANAQMSLVIKEWGCC
jgi:hypothetical protein